MSFCSRLKIFLILALATSSCTKLLPNEPTKTADAVYAIAISVGDQQTGNANATLSSSLVVRVTNKATGAPADNISVSWSVASGGGHFVSQFNHTSPLGEAPATLALGSTPGTNTVTATVSTGDLVTFTATGVIGTPSAGNSSISGSSPIEPDGINTSTISITIRDSSNNAIAGTTPTFSATGSTNSYGACSATNASGVSTCTLSSTTTETKILSITSPVSKVGGIVVFAPGPVNAALSSISGTGPVIADGVATSTVTVTLKDASNVAVGGVVPTFSATDSGGTNTYATCSASNVSGVSTCTLTSTHAESKTLSITSPVSKAGGTVSFIPGAPSSLHSTLTGTGPTENNGIATSTITVLLQDANSNPVSGTIPTFSATNTGSSNSYGACSSSNASGNSTCTLSSTTAETKTLSLLSPLALTGGSVVFAPGPVVAGNSSITGTSPVLADGIATSTVTITLRDALNVPVAGRVPTFSATNTGTKNTYGTCSTSNTSGVSTCTLSSTHSETKILSLTSPVSFAGGSVVFNAGTPSALTSTITGTTSIIADGSTQSTVTITLKDTNSNPVAAITPTFSATNTGAGNAYGACSSTSATGVSTCTLSSTKAEVKALSIASPVSVSGGTVTFIHGTPSVVTSTITGSGPVPPDGSSTSNISISLKDAFNNPVNAVTPTFSATNSGGSNIYGSCSVSSALGLSTCTLASSQSETKTLSLTSPISMSGGTVVFAAGSASALYSSITGTGSITANGASTSTVTVVLKDSSNIAIVGTVPSFSATNSNNGNTYGACSATDASGSATCSLSSTKAETKTLSIASPISLAGGSVTFTSGVAAASTSQITGTSPATADGISTSSVTVVLYDTYNNPVSGVVPTFTATNTGGSNSYGTCSSSDATGASTCTLASTAAEAKTLSLTTPVSKSGGSVSFSAGTPIASNSSISGSGSVLADGVSTSSVTITLIDQYGNPVSGQVPTFSATNSGGTNAYGTCSSSNASGASLCALTSTRAETKTLSVATPVSLTGGTVSFVQAASPTYSTITGSGPKAADGTTSSSITITLKDYSNTAMVGVVPSFSATDTNNTNIYSACSATSGTGASTCTLKTLQAETKTLTLTSPATFDGGSVVFTQKANPANSSIVGTGPVQTSGTNYSNITITLHDYMNVGIAGVVPTFSATNTGNSNIYSVCSSSDANGVSTCTLDSNNAQTKTLKITAPITLTGGTVLFN